MRRFAKLFVPALKIGVISVATVSTLGFAYLQYINSIIGPINWNKDEIVAAYKDRFVCSESKATTMYYQDLFNFSKLRILYYLSYKSSCENFNKKIADYSINSYEQQDIFNTISKAGPIKANKAVHSTIFEKIKKIRAKNKENNELRTYLVKQIQEMQSLLRTTINPVLKEESKTKIDQIYKYLTQVGLFFRDPEFIKYSQNLSKIEKRYPNDYFYKILII